MNPKLILSTCAGLLATSLAIAQRTIPNDPDFDQQWALRAIGATNAWARSTGDSNLVVAIICTGIRYDHEDLAANMWRNPGEIPANGIDDDSNGYVDVFYGIDVVDRDSDPQDAGFGGPPYPGTVAAGVVGAVGQNGKGVTGVNWSVKLMAIRHVNTNNSGIPGGQIEELNYMRQMITRGVHLRVVCFVIAGNTPQQPVRDLLEALDKLGVVAVAPALFSVDNDLTPGYPACYGLPNLISVAGCDEAGQLTARSGWGRTNIHLAAPSALVRSTDGGAANEYVTLDSASIVPAVAHVAGAAALLAAAWPDATPAQIKTALLESVDLLPGLKNKVSTHGRLNVGRAMDYLTAVMSSTPTLPPLGIARSGSSVILSWPEGASAVLEQTSTLPSLPQAWTTVSGPLETNGLSVTITVPVADRAFFRLRRP